MRTHAGCERKARCNALWSIWIAVLSVARGLPLFLSARPKTPLRALCIIAFDAIHAIRSAERLPAAKVRAIAALLDLGACANAAFDSKAFCQQERGGILQLLGESGVHAPVAEYLERLGHAESRRPLPGGDHGQFQQVRLYRESVVRLSLGMIAATVDGIGLDDGISATFHDSDLHILFRIAMQFQIIDDVLDYSKDMAGGLPSFLTATKSLSEALELTRSASLHYADDRELPRIGRDCLWRTALRFVSICTRLAIVLGRWKHPTRRFPTDIVVPMDSSDTIPLRPQSSKSRLIGDSF